MKQDQTRPISVCSSTFADIKLAIDKLQPDTHKISEYIFDLLIRQKQSYSSSHTPPSPPSQGEAKDGEITKLKYDLKRVRIQRNEYQERLIEAYRRLGIREGGVTATLPSSKSIDDIDKEEVLKQIEQMSDAGDPYLTITRMKDIATTALKSKALPISSGVGECFWTDALVLEYAVKSHLPNQELTIQEFKKSKETSQALEQTATIQ